MLQIAGPKVVTDQKGLWLHTSISRVVPAYTGVEQAGNNEAAYMWSQLIPNSFVCYFLSAFEYSKSRIKTVQQRRKREIIAIIF